MPRIIPSLWFDMNAEEAMNYYVQVFRDAKINKIDYYPDESLDEHFKGMKGKVINGDFELEGQRFICLDGGPAFKFNEAISFTIECDTQEEIDYYWDSLSHVPESEQCGWCKDRFGVSWQIVPKKLAKLLADEDPKAVERVTVAVMQSKKFNIAELEAVHQGYQG